jgi:hypothetical protein
MNRIKGPSFLHPRESGDLPFLKTYQNKEIPAFVGMTKREKGYDGIGKRNDERVIIKNRKCTK